MTANNEEVFYVLRHLTGQYVHQDKTSGGYPALVSGFSDAHQFASFEDAFRYKGIFSRNQFGSDSWRIVRCEVSMATVSLSSHLESKRSEPLTEEED